MKFPDYVFVGIRGSVVALDRITGAIVWQTKLKSAAGFVNLVRDDVFIYATSYGEAFCLDPTDGQIRWHNPLKGFGIGLASLLAAGVSEQQSALLAAERVRQEQESSSTMMSS